MSAASGDVWFVLPTANAENCARNLPAWRERGYRIALLQDRVRFEAEADAIIAATKYPGWGAAVNRLFREAVPSSCQVVVAGGDDMLPDPHHSAAEIRDQFLDHFQGSFGVMQPTGDDYEATRVICGSPWLGRAWMQRMYQGQGGMPETYTHQWADDELYWVARCAGRFWARPDLTQHHDHFLRRGESAPAYWAESAGRHEEQDCLTFIARSRSGFPGAASLEQPLDLRVFEREYSNRAERSYAQRHGSAQGDQAARKIEAALEQCAAQGHSRVAIFGAGQHTRRAGSALCDPPVMVLGILDDDPDRIGSRLWNFPIISTEQAHSLGLDAIILSSDSMEERLAQAARPLERAGVEIIRLYTTPQAREIA